MLAAGRAALLLAAALAPCRGHEYLSTPPARTADCLLNAVLMGETLCHLYPGDDNQCLEDPLTYSHLFHLHPAYRSNACGGATGIRGADGGSQGLAQRCGDAATAPAKFNMSVAGPEATTQWRAGSEVELQVSGFFHPGVMRVAMCYRDDSPCQAPGDFDYVLGYHFTEGTAGDDDAPKGIYSVVMPFRVRVPGRGGRAVLQWTVDAEDVRSYVSCSDVEVTGGSAAGREYTCNGHPLCNCTTSAAPAAGGVGLGATCPQGVAPSVRGGSATGTDIVRQYKEQLGAAAFCELCITNGCPSTCGGKYNGYYQGPKCTNEPVVAGCNGTHATALPKYLECTPAACTSRGWAPSPAAGRRDGA